LEAQYQDSQKTWRLLEFDFWRGRSLGGVGVVEGSIDGSNKYKQLETLSHEIKIK
jgi:hypothetical protein